MKAKFCLIIFGLLAVGLLFLQKNKLPQQALEGEVVGNSHVFDDSSDEEKAERVPTPSLAEIYLSAEYNGDKISEMKDWPGYVSRLDALAAVKNLVVSKTLVKEYPAFWDNFSVYVSRNIRPLKEAWTPVNFFDTDKRAQFRKTNQDLMVWNILVDCSLKDCEEQFKYLLQKYFPEEKEYQHNGYYEDDLLFIVDARTGKVILFGRGEGQRGDASAFIDHWLPIELLQSLNK